MCYLLVSFLLVIRITSHLDGLNDICQSCSHSSRFCRSSCSMATSLGVLIFFVQETVVSKESGGGFYSLWQVIDVSIKERRGPSTDPCGTPEVSDVDDEEWPSIITLWLRSSRKL